MADYLMLHRLFRKPTDQPTGHISSTETILGTDSSFKGTLVIEGELRIDGKFRGNLGISGQLIISEGAIVDADITAQSVSISGHVKGTIAAERVSILSSGRVYADLATNEFTSEEGCHFRGEVTLL